MPLKDHRAELHAASAIAGLIKYQAYKKLNSQGLLIGALRGVAAQKQAVAHDVVLLEKNGVTFGGW